MKQLNKTYPLIKLVTLMKFISIFFLAVIASFNLHAAEVCIDPASDPDGDGWGFEQEASCFVVISGTGPNGELLSPAAVESQSVCLSSAHR